MAIVEAMPLKRHCTVVKRVAMVIVSIRPEVDRLISKLDLELALLGAAGHCEWTS